MSDDGQRLADETIYLGEKRHDKPKEVFRRLGDMIADEARPGPASVLDVGCATGELLYYLAGRFPGWRFAGIDPIPSLIEEAKKTVTGADFTLGSILDGALFRERQYDVVICTGVLPIFDDIAAPITNLLACLREKGTLYISCPFNDDPIDVRLRYRPSDDVDGPWQSGWNIHSKVTVERLLADSGHDLEWFWHTLRMPFALEKRGDPMRSWTIHTKADPFQRVNGACQLLNVSALQVRLNRVVS